MASSPAGTTTCPKNLTLNDLSEVRYIWGWYRTKLLRNRERIMIDDYLTDELSDAAVDFIQRRHDRPFFVYLAYNAPHTPLQATAKYLDSFSHIKDPRRRTYAAMVSAVDDGVGRVLKALDESGVADNTIVAFLSDNGGAQNNTSINAPLRGNKGSFFEGGFRVPFAIRWPAQFPTGTDYDLPVSSLDLFATMAAHTDAKPLPGKPLDGVDLVPYVQGERQDPPHGELYWRNHDKNMTAIRAGDLKRVTGQKELDAALFNLADDLSEKTPRQNAGESDSLQERYGNVGRRDGPPSLPKAGVVGVRVAATLLSPAAAAPARQYGRHEHHEGRRLRNGANRRGPLSRHRGAKAGSPVVEVAAERWAPAAP